MVAVLLLVERRRRADDTVGRCRSPGAERRRDLRSGVPRRELRPGEHPFWRACDQRRSEPVRSDCSDYRPRGSCHSDVAAAQTTPWGDPDLQGVWSKQTPVPLERPAALANKPFFTAAGSRRGRKERARLGAQERRRGNRHERRVQRDLAGIGKGRVHRNRSTSLVVDPPDGKIPFTPEGRARWASTPNLATERMTGKAAGRGHVGGSCASGALHHVRRHVLPERVLQQLSPDRAGPWLRRDRHRKHARRARDPARSPPACRARTSGRGLAIHADGGKGRRLSSRRPTSTTSGCFRARRRMCGSSSALPAWTTTRSITS